MTEHNKPTQIDTGSIGWRIFWSGALFLLYGFVNHLVTPVATLASGKIAGGQFANDDASYLVSTYGINFFGHIGWPFWLFLVLLALIWLRPARALIQASLGVGLLLTVAAPQQASAYFNKTDWPEIYFILPNESAFYIPDVGANKDDQAKFMSEEYLNTNKIAAKRFQVPHVKLTGSSYGFDYYVPAGRLIIVDRTPYAREWTADAARGTSQSNEGFKCQSKDGLDIQVGIAIAASVYEQDAPRFLYRFGVKPPVGDRNTDDVKFVSVFQGRNLIEVMDFVVKGKVQSLICSYFSPRNLEQVNADASAIMVEAEKAVKDYLIKENGISLDYLGWGDTFEFDPVVQKAINDRYAADKIAPVLSTLERQAQVKMQEGIAQGLIGLGEGLKAHGLPSNLIAIPDSVLKMLGSAAPIAQTPVPAR